jgi:hypothetical protein
MQILLRYIILLECEKITWQQWETPFIFLSGGDNEPLAICTKILYGDRK